MALFDKPNRGSATLDRDRLETPLMAGYRAGMSSSSVIGRKLSSIFGVEASMPREMDCCIRELQTKLGRSR